MSNDKERTKGGQTHLDEPNIEILEVLHVLNSLGNVPNLCVFVSTAVQW